MISNFYLTGGTALSLHLGHRESEDLDFFSQKQFSPQQLQLALNKLGSLTDVELEKGTLNCFLNGVKLQFLHYPYSLLQPPIVYKRVKISSLIDVTCTKLVTISSRGDKKDFVDLYELLKHFNLKDLFKSLDKKYKKLNYNKTTILKSLIYFEDAESQPMPRMHLEVNWQQIKKSITQKVKKYKF